MEARIPARNGVAEPPNCSACGFAPGRAPIALSAAMQSGDRERRQMPHAAACGRADREFRPRHRRVIAALSTACSKTAPRWSLSRTTSPWRRAPIGPRSCATAARADPGGGAAADSERRPIARRTRSAARACLRLRSRGQRHGHASRCRRGDPDQAVAGFRRRRSRHREHHRQASSSRWILPALFAPAR